MGIDSWLSPAGAVAMVLEQKGAIVKAKPVRDWCVSALMESKARTDNR